MCHLPLAAAQLHWQAGAPGTYIASAAGEHGRPQQAIMPVLKPEVAEAEIGRDILARLAQGLVRLLTNAPALTAALLLVPPTTRRTTATSGGLS